MGFLKKIGKSIKGVTKMVSTKNLIKVATGRAGELKNELITRSAKPFLSSAEQRAIEGKPEPVTGGGNGSIVEAMQERTNPNFGQILGGGLAGIGTVLAGSTAGAAAAGAAGATVVDSTITEWFKRNWLKVVGGAVVVIGLIVVAVRLGRGKSTRRR